MSIMEAGTIALDTTCIEVDWLKNFLFEMPLVYKPLLAKLNHCDCKATIDKCKQKNSNFKMNMHIKVRHKSIM